MLPAALAAALCGAANLNPQFYLCLRCERKECRHHPLRSASLARATRRAMSKNIPQRRASRKTPISCLRLNGLNLLSDAFRSATIWSPAPMMIEKAMGLPPGWSLIGRPRVLGSRRWPPWLETEILQLSPRLSPSAQLTFLSPEPNC